MQFLEQCSSYNLAGWNFIIFCHYSYALYFMHAIWILIFYGVPTGSESFCEISCLLRSYIYICVTIENGNVGRIVVLEIFKPGVCLLQSENHFMWDIGMPLCVCMCVLTDP